VSLFFFTFCRKKNNMKFPKRRHRIVIECHSTTDIRLRYEYTKPPRGWTRMHKSELKRFLETNHCWEITAVIDNEEGVTENVVDIKTPTTLKEANQVIKEILDSAMGDNLRVYYAQITALVV